MDFKLITRSRICDGLDLGFDNFADAGSPAMRPFDLRELENLPQPSEEHPPYHSWWVVDKL